MNRVIAIASGKGGVGKTTVCCHLGRELARQGEKTILVELDCGLRGLDLLLNVENILYDLDDLLQAKCQLAEAIVPTREEGLSLLAAPAKFKRVPTAREIELLCRALLTKYDRVLLDSSAGFWMAPAIARAADLVLLVATPDEICIRDAEFFAQHLRSLNPDSSIRLLLNKVKKSTMGKFRYKDLDEVIDQVGEQIIGVIPESKRIPLMAERRRQLFQGTSEASIFSALAGRVLGEDIPIVSWMK